MLLTAFVVLQLLFDVVLVLLWATGVLRRRAARGGEAPPDWYPQFVALAQEVLAMTEPVLDALEASPPAPAPAPAPAPVETPDRHREAAALLRAGADPDDVARQSGLLPGELALLKNLVAAAADRRPPGDG